MQEGEEDDQVKGGEVDSTKEIMKSFLVSVVNLVSCLTKDEKKARENQELLQSLADLLKQTLYIV